MSLNILVTGANSGFGLAIAAKAARAGHRVNAGVRNFERAAPLLALKDEGLPIELLQLDVTRDEEVAAAVAAAEARGPIDVLVNNAGFEVVGPVEELTDELLLRQFDVNVFGLVRMIRGVAPGMRTRRQGRIINVSSTLGHISLAHRGAYAASKHAVEGLSKALWQEMRPFGVQVVCLAPGAFPTAFAANYVYAPRFDETSPFWPYELEVRKNMGAYVASYIQTQSADDVAEVVLRAATEPEPAFHQFAGQDAEHLVSLSRSKPFEDYMEEWFDMAGMKDLLAGPADYIKR